MRPLAVLGAATVAASVASSTASAAMCEAIVPGLPVLLIVEQETVGKGTEEVRTCVRSGKVTQVDALGADGSVEIHTEYKGLKPLLVENFKRRIHTTYSILEDEGDLRVVVPGSVLSYQVETIANGKSSDVETVRSELSGVSQVSVADCSFDVVTVARRGRGSDGEVRTADIVYALDLGWPLHSTIRRTRADGRGSREIRVRTTRIESTEMARALCPMGL